METFTENLSPIPFDIQTVLNNDYNKVNETIQALLSSARQIRENLEVTLSAIPVHPYERLKMEYLDPDEPAICLDDIKAPLAFSPSATVHSITAISEEFDKTTIQAIGDISKNFYETTNIQMAALSANDIENSCNAFVSLSDNVFVVDKQRTSNHLRFLEMIRNIPIESVDTNAEEIARKVLSQFITLYSK